MPSRQDRQDSEEKTTEDSESTEGGKERPGASIVEPRWGSVVWVIGDPACAARHWALEFNAVGVKGGCILGDCVTLAWIWRSWTIAA